MANRTTALVAALAGLVAAPVAAAEKNAKYYFKIAEINTQKASDPSVSELARDLLQKELEARPEFTSDLGGVNEIRGVIAELKKRRLQGFNVSLRLDKVSKELRPPKPGGRLKQLAVDVKLSVFGTTLPGEKLAFGGDGEAALEAEVVERRMDEEGVTMTKDVMGQAIKQALDQAVMKLSLPKSVPMNESRRKKPKK